METFDRAIMILFFFASLLFAIVLDTMQQKRIIELEKTVEQQIKTDENMIEEIRIIFNERR